MTKNILALFVAAVVYSYLYKKHQLTHLEDVIHTGSCSSEADSFSLQYSCQPAHSGVFRCTHYIQATSHHHSYLLFPFIKPSIKNTNMYSIRHTPVIMKISASVMKRGKHFCAFFKKE